MPKPILLAIALLAAAAPLQAQDIKFGDDSGAYPDDGECDDRRFHGTGMAAELSWEQVGRDASDCREALEAGRVALWEEPQARAATRCEAIQWGDDSSEYASDGVCDDPRFEGRGSATLLLSEDAGRDAADCRRLCAYGLIFLRDY